MNNDIHSFVDMEKIEESIENQRIAISAGYMTYERFLEKKQSAVHGLTTFGGSFSRALGHALDVADKTNTLKIMRYFNHEIEQHSLLWEIYQAKLKAQDDQKDCVSC